MRRLTACWSSSARCARTGSSAGARNTEKKPDSNIVSVPPRQSSCFGLLGMSGRRGTWGGSRAGNNSSRGGGSSRGGAFAYSLNLAGGRKYVGMTTNINRRLAQHFSGNGAAFTQRYPPLSVNHVQRCRSVTTARRAETIVYGNMARYHGTRVVRGAGYTRSR